MVGCGDGRRADDDLRNPCHLRRNDGHQQGGWQRGGAAGHVNPHTLDGCDALPQPAAQGVCFPVGQRLQLVEEADALCSGLHGCLQLAGQGDGMLFLNRIEEYGSHPVRFYPEGLTSGARHYRLRSGLKP